MNKIDLAITKYPKARRVAIENFTMGKEGKGLSMADCLNLEYDAKCYGWKPDTVKAIKFVMAR